MNIKEISNNISQLTDLEVESGYYVLLIIKGRSRYKWMEKPLFLFHKVSKSEGGWGGYLIHGINLEKYISELNKKIEKSDSNTFAKLIENDETQEKIKKVIERLFKTKNFFLEWTGECFSRIKFSFRTKKEKIYLYYLLLVTFIESDGSDKVMTNLRKSNPFDDWQWFDINDMKKDPIFMLTMSDIANFFIDFENGFDRFSFDYSVKNVKTSLVSLWKSVCSNWMNKLSFIVVILTIISFLTSIVNFCQNYSDNDKKKTYKKFVLEYEQLVINSKYLSDKDISDEDKRILKKKIEESKKYISQKENSEKKHLLRLNLKAYSILKNKKDVDNTNKHLKLLEYK